MTFYSWTNLLNVPVIYKVTSNGTKSVAVINHLPFHTYLTWILQYKIVSNHLVNNNNGLYTRHKATTTANVENVGIQSLVPSLYTYVNSVGRDLCE